MAVQFQLADHDLAAKGPAKRASLVLPEAICRAVLGTLDALAGKLVCVGVSPNAITIVSIGLGAAGGVLLGFGRFGEAAAVMTVASLGDALDGLVARRGGSASVGGALLDASGDRYQEFFFLGGLAVFFRESALALVVTLLALAGSFMVSYGSAKAEALGIPVPSGVMRRPERAACLCGAAALAALLDRWTLRSGPAVVNELRAVPLLGALVLIAVLANASAIRRLRGLARSAARLERRSDTSSGRGMLVRLGQDPFQERYVARSRRSHPRQAPQP